MWQSLYCYLTGQHEYNVTCEPGAIFLRCRACGQRSSGWEFREAELRRAAGRAHALAPVETRRDQHRHAA